jgi:hypothetical protein
MRPRHNPPIYNLDGQATAAHLVPLPSELAVEYSMEGFMFRGSGTGDG